MGKVPHDTDLCSDARPDEMLKIFESAGYHCIPTGLQHGTITVVMDGIPYEITTLRIDQETDGRHAVVQYTRDFRLDASRRDFTFNAMSLDMAGNLFDYFNGHDDLKAGRVVFVGGANERIREDYLRVLRYYRFHSRLPESSMDPEVEQIIRVNLDGMNRLSVERIWSEMQKILVSDRAADILVAMDRCGVLEAIGLPSGDIQALADSRVNNHLIKMVNYLGDLDVVDLLADRWKWSNTDRSLALHLAANRNVPVDLRTAKREVFNGADVAHWSLLLAMQGQPADSETLVHWTAPRFPISGHDLIRAGMVPGKTLGEKLQKIKDIWADSEYSLSREELLQQLG
jgi:tRNA nucleotidyltransferase/poly(A) polymerase